MIRVIRRFLRRGKREPPVIPDRFVDYCEGGDMPPGLYETRTQKFRYYFTAYPNLQSPSRAANDLDGVQTRHTHRSISIAYNSIQEKLYGRLFDAMSSFDDAWLEKNDAFIQGLSPRLRFALAALTNKSQQHVQSYLRGEDMRPFCDRVRRWNTRVYGFLPVFFPLCMKKSPTRAEYDAFVRDACPLLTDKQIIDAVAKLVQDVRHVFRACPKTTRTMVLWRGIRSTPSPDVVGFAATSINPFHALRYADEGCCLQRVLVLPNTPLLFLGGLSTFKKELECLLPDGTFFFEQQRAHATIPTLPETKQKCPTRTRRIFIQHVVALPPSPQSRLPSRSRAARGIRGSGSPRPS